MTTTHTKRFRVAEIFGPTIQGEGNLIGMPCYFVRFGGCDYRCSWCDSMHAVDPEHVAQLPQMTTDEIVERVRSLPGDARWVVLSGGNPALFDLEELVAQLHDAFFLVMCETQGTVGNPWLRRIDDLTISPKPPSSGNVTSVEDLCAFFDASEIDAYVSNVSLKIVVFDAEDYEYARHLHADNRLMLPMFISVGNPIVELGAPLEHQRVVLLDRLAFLMEHIAHDPDMCDVRVLPQLHVLAWGNARAR